MLDWIVNTITALGYWGIALLMFLENVFPPLPSEVIMPLAGFSVTRGELKLSYVVLAGIIGSVLGTLPWYYLGSAFGLRGVEKLAHQYGKYLTISAEDVGKAKRWFDRRGNWATCCGRLVPGIRTYISVPAGISKMSILTYFLYSTLGTTVWVGMLAYLGYLLGSNYTQVAEFISSISRAIIVGLSIAFVVWIVKRKQRH